MYKLQKQTIYTPTTKWIAKLFIDFCRRYKLMWLLHNRSESIYGLCGLMANIKSMTFFFEERENLIAWHKDADINGVSIRRQLWWFYLIEHQDKIPSYYKIKNGLGSKDLMRFIEFEKEKCVKDERLYKLYNKHSIKKTYE